MSSCIFEVRFVKHFYFFMFYGVCLGYHNRSAEQANARNLLNGNHIQTSSAACHEQLSDLADKDANANVLMHQQWASSRQDEAQRGEAMLHAEGEQDERLCELEKNQQELAAKAAAEQNKLLQASVEKDTGLSEAINNPHPSPAIAALTVSSTIN